MFPLQFQTIQYNTVPIRLISNFGIIVHFSVSGWRLLHGLPVVQLPSSICNLYVWSVSMQIPRARLNNLIDNAFAD